MMYTWSLNAPYLEIVNRHYYHYDIGPYKPQSRHLQAHIGPCRPHIDPCRPHIDPTYRPILIPYRPYIGSLQTPYWLVPTGPIRHDQGWSHLLRKFQEEPRILFYFN